MNGVDSIVKDFKQSFPLFFFVFIGLHFDFVLILQIAKFLLLLVDLIFNLGLFLDDLLLFEQVLSVSFYFHLK